MNWTPQRIIISVAVVAIVGLGAYLLGSQLQPDQPAATTAQNEQPAATAETAEEPAGFGPEVKRQYTSAPVYTYEQALNDFRDRRIQLENCVADPSTVTYKTGTKVMFDNRSSEPTEIKLDGRPVRLWGYEFRIVTLSSRSLPHTIDVDCEWLGEPSYNIARILLQQ